MSANPSEQALEPAAEESRMKQSQPPARLWLQSRKLVALLFWLLLVGGYFLYIRRTGQSPREVAQALQAFLEGNALGPLFYVVLYTVRPLVFFPATVLSVMGGYLYGPIWGLVYSSLGAILSATLAYLVGRYFGAGLFQENQDATHFMARYTRFLRSNGFEAVLIMRLLYLPYDLVNYLSGLVRVGLVSFVVATLLGNLPGSLTFVLFGSALSSESSQGRWFLAGFSLLMLVLGLVFSRWLRRRRRDLTGDEAAGAEAPL